MQWTLGLVFVVGFVGIAAVMRQPQVTTWREFIEGMEREPRIWYRLRLISRFLNHVKPENEEARLALIKVRSDVRKAMLQFLFSRMYSSVFRKRYQELHETLVYLCYLTQPEFSDRVNEALAT